jgi:NADPH:quinone reductase-like Zn-dependent oxidoreductase
MPTAIVIRKADPLPSGEIWYPLAAQALPPPSPKPHEIVVRLAAAALNHRDVFIRQHQYPGAAFAVPLLADGVGVVTAAGSDADARKWLGRRVVLNPARGWREAREGPEPEAGGFAILGGTKYYPAGTLADEGVFDAAEAYDAPAHLSDAQAAALPLAGLTAWRALVSKSGAAERGAQVLVTGAGGGVALMVVLFAVRMGVGVWVTSGSGEKIEGAVRVGARGGVSYKEDGWEKRLVGLLPRERPVFDAIIDGAGGEIVNKAARLLKVCSVRYPFLEDEADEKKARRRGGLVRDDAGA